MGRRPQINLFELGEMIRSGKRTQEMAAHFGVSVRAVQAQAQKLKLNISKTAALHESHQVLRQNLDAREQLLRINESANRLLGLLERQIEQDQEVIIGGVLAQLVELKKRLDKDDVAVVKKAAAAIKEMPVSRPGTMELLLKAQAEIRQQVALVVKVTAELLEANRVNEIHRVMVEEIGVESPECRRRIIQRLQSSELLLTAVGFA